MWLGLSVITIFEFIELIWDVLFLCFFKIYGLPTVKPFPGDKDQNENQHAPMEVATGNWKRHENSTQHSSLPPVEITNKDQLELMNM